MANRLDLHMHSNVSIDGQYMPRELMELCRESGLKTVSLTDHNSLRGIAEAQEAALEFGLNFIPGIELDCQYQGVDLHLLGYGIRPSTDFIEYEQELLKNERTAFAERIELVQELGIYFDVDKALELSVQGIVSGEMIAEIALKDGRNRSNPLLAPYRDGGSRADNPCINFYWDFCAQGKPCYIPMEYISLATAVGLINQAGGLSVLAHPGINIGLNKTILQGIVACGIQGIEVYSNYHDAATVAFFKRQAEELQLLKTMGSDFHGKTKPAVKLGTPHCPEEEEIHNSIRLTLGLS